VNQIVLRRRVSKPRSFETQEVPQSLAALFRGFIGFPKALPRSKEDSFSRIAQITFTRGRSRLQARGIQKRSSLPRMQNQMVRAVGVEPTRALRPCGFSYRLRLSPLAPLAPSRFGGFAVWTIPSPYSAILEVRRCPSSLYTFPAKTSVQAWLGIAS
jgi:hypothetical protein